jgi:large subunit ribosomal protein L25
MADVLHVENRDKLGSANSRRLRASGKVAAVLYGHGEPNVHLSVPANEVMALIRHHGRTVQLSGGAEGHALVKSVQWDAFGSEVLHLDFYRVSLDETVAVTIGVELKGDAPGLGSGGMLNHAVYEITIQCPAGSIPDSLTLSISDLQLGQHKTAADVPLPQGATLITPPETVLVSVDQKIVKADDELGGGTSEPEVIKKPAKETVE